MDKEEKNKKLSQVEELLVELVRHSTLEERNQIEKIFNKWKLRLAYVDALEEAAQEVKENEENHQRTFVQKLVGHNKYCNEIMGKARRLLTQAQENDDISKSEQFISRAEKLVEIVDIASQKFDNEHEAELKALISYVDAQRR